MESKLKAYLSNYLNLPAEFITNEADLNTLCILSLFFKDQAAEFGITTTDIDLEKLSIGFSDFKREARNQTLKLRIEGLLKQSVPPEVRQRVIYEDSIGSEGYVGYELEAMLVVLDLPSEISHNLVTSDDFNNCETVNDMIQKLSKFYN